MHTWEEMSGWNGFASDFEVIIDPLFDLKCSYYKETPYFRTELCFSKFLNFFLNERYSTKESIFYYPYR